MSEVRDRHKIVDSNEPESIRTKLLENGWEQGRLFSGDYSFFTIDFKRVGIERKEVGDLIASLGERLSRQLDSMLDYYDFPILLIEGTLKQVADTGQILSSRGLERWLMNTLRNFIRTWQDRGITIETTFTTRDTIQRLGELYAYYQKVAHTGGLTRKQVGDKRLLAFPQGVGLKTAEKVLEGRSLHDVAEMSVVQLREIESVGQKRAEDIRIHFNRR